MRRQWTVFLLVVLYSLNAKSDSLPQIDRLPYFPPSALKKLPECESRTIDAYRKIGSRSSKWDSNAEPALLIFARYICWNPVVAGTTNFATMTNALALALKEGCNDPLVRYAAVRMQQFESSPTPRSPVERSRFRSFLTGEYRKIIAGLEAHPYPAILQSLIYMRAAQCSQTREDRPQIRIWLEVSGVRLAEAIRDKADRDQIYGTAGEISDLYQRTLGDREPLFDYMRAQFNKYSITNVRVARVLNARFFIDSAWDARGGGTADKVTADGTRLFHERLATARKLLEVAWKADPTDSFVCSQMMGALAAVGRPRNEWEPWFERGKQANPSDRSLYHVKLNYLLPKWGGSTQAVLQFGRECVNPMAAIEVVVKG